MIRIEFQVYIQKLINTSIIIASYSPVFNYDLTPDLTPENYHE